MLVPGAALAQVPEFGAQTAQSADGYATITWEHPTDLTDSLFEVAVTDPAGDEQFYEVQQASIFLSGLPDGEYVVRVRHVNGDEPDWSEPLTLSVTHHSLSLAFVLFAAGGLMFLWIVAFLIRNDRRVQAMEGSVQ